MSNDLNDGKKKIAIVVGQLTFGGAERQIVLLTKGLKGSNNYSPVVFCLSEKTYPNGKELTKLNIEWYMLPKNIHTKIGKLSWLIQSVKMTHCSLLYGFLNIGNIYAGATSMFLQIPFVGSIRNADNKLPFLVKSLSGYFCNRANYVIANSKSSLDSLSKDLHVKHSRLRIIPNAIESFPVRSRKKLTLSIQYGIPENAFIIGTVALLKKQKRPEFFLEVAQILPREIEGRPIYFIYIGDGPEKQNIENKIAHLPENMKERLYFLGAKTNIFPFLIEFDLFILTSAYEGMPNALLEAMSVGLPCVVTDVPGSNDILNGKEVGVLASNSNPLEFARMTLNLLKDPAGMKLIGKEAQKHVQSHYSLDKMILAHCDIFDKVVDNQHIKRQF